MIKFNDIEKRQHLVDRGWEFVEDHFICPRDNERVDFYTLKSPRLRQACTIYDPETDVVTREAEAVALQYWNDNCDKIRELLCAQLEDLAYRTFEPLSDNFKFEVI